MKQNYLRSALLILILALAIFAQPPNPIPARAEICGNLYVTEKQKVAAFEYLLSEGCNDIHFVYIGKGQFLAYGTKVLMGE